MPENRTNGENQPSRQNVLLGLMPHTPRDVDLPSPPADNDNIASLNALTEDQLFPILRPVKTENGIAPEIGDLMRARRAGAPASLLRLSAGIQAVEGLWSDPDLALSIAVAV